MVAVNGTLTFERPNRTRFGMSGYWSGVNAVPVKIRRDGPAGGNDPDGWSSTEVCALVDICLTGATDIANTTVKKNDMPVTPIILANHLASVVSRPELAVLCLPGERISLFQVT